jgi:hypothetical protein
VIGHRFSSFTFGDGLRPRMVNNQPTYCHEKTFGTL